MSDFLGLLIIVRQSEKCFFHVLVGRTEEINSSAIHLVPFEAHMLCGCEAGALASQGVLRSTSLHQGS